MNIVRRLSRPALKSRYRRTPEVDKSCLFLFFFYNLCKEQGLDPDNLQVCDRWHEILEDQKTRVTGVYVYLVHWADGRKRQGTLEFSDTNNSPIILRAP